MKTFFTRIKENKFYYFMWLFAALVNVKTLFVEYCADEGYAIAMAIRMTKGDKLLAQMWEPHQTSAFLMAGLTWVFKKLTGSYEGIVVFMHVCGLILYGVLAFLLIKTSAKIVDKKVAGYMGMIVFALRAKMTQLPDYSNLTIIFTGFLLIFLIRAFITDKKIYNYILAAVFYFLSVLAYPTNIIIFIPLIVLILLFSEKEKKARNVLVTTATALILGGGYALFFVIRSGLSEVIYVVKKIIGSDTHSTSQGYGWGFLYFREFLMGLAIVAVCAGLAFLMSKLFKNRIKSFSFLSCFAVLLLIFVCAESVIFTEFVKVPMLGEWCLYFIIIFAVILTGAFGIKRLSKTEFTVYLSGMLISLGTVIAVIALTKMPFLTVFGYLHFAAAVSFIPISKLTVGVSASTDKAADPNAVSGAEAGIAGKRLALLIPACIMVILLHQLAQYYRNFDAFIDNGPRKGMIWDLAESGVWEAGYTDFQNYIKPEDKVFICCSDPYMIYDPLFYAYADCNITTYSTISTPASLYVISDTLDEYWKKYPEKEPDVVVAPQWNVNHDGVNLSLWLGEERAEKFTYKDDGVYWSFLRRQ